MKQKTEAWKSGWYKIMDRLTALKYKPDQDVYIESIHYELNRFLFVAVDEYKEYAYGMLAAINLFEKIGFVPVDMKEI